MIPQPLNVRFPSTPRHATRARQAFRVYLALLHLDARMESDLESAIGEALANVIEDAYAQETFFELRCNLEHASLTIEIENHGRIGGAEHKLDRPDVSRDFGLNIMRALVDDVTLLKDGRLIRLQKTVKGAKRRRPRRAAKTAAMPEPTG